MVVLVPLFPLWAKSKDTGIMLIFYPNKVISTFLKNKVVELQ